VSVVGEIMMKEFKVELWDGMLHIFSDGWSTTTCDPDMAKREFNKFLDECTELYA